ncbi:MAG: RnfABCDGE type electron transport complex subunit D [Muribaculaceae bacterium]|nr:RnfABCDGE type electron transport complex subunit D [Muribaculaceae bacterium]MEE1298388.1 RnfABCDGE type electron transport complex subunit D [Muribaculaceae bacterium]
MSNRRLIVSGSPHIHTGSSVKSRMWGVVIALLPALAFSLYAFGIGALVVIAVSVLGCVMTEYLIQRYLIKGELTITNGSAVITGLLLAMNLPSNLPVWIVLIGCVVAIGLGKYAFGGLGQNIFNPAILGRVFLLISFPQQMTSWPLPMVNRASYLDATTGATILGKMKLNELVPDNVDLMGAFMGQMGGSLGEMCGLAILLGGAYLLVRRIISWHIPVSIIATVALFSWCAGINPLVSILSGGVLLGAVFMATDYVTSPMTHKGMVLYGVMIGVITMIIRLWGAYPEGVSFAILIMNGFTPLINKYMRPRQFGERKVK